MSNLIVRSTSTSTGSVPQSNQTVASNSVDDDGIKFDEIWQTLRRRSKLVFTTAGTVFVLSLINFLDQRINNPLFAGSFTLLISDPLSEERRDSSGNSASFEQLARNTPSNDIPTLIEVLRSPLLLQPVANNWTSRRRSGLPDHYLAGRQQSCRSPWDPQRESHRAQTGGNGTHAQGS